jgi:LysR family transcriptional regulator, glycine cleavage system transcriptional activator
VAGRRRDPAVRQRDLARLRAEIPRRAAAPARTRRPDGETLLHLSKFDRNWVTWESFLAAFDVTEEPKDRGVTFDNYLVLIQSTLRGEGIALCGRRLAEDFIADGDLVRPVDASLKSDRGFYLIRPREVAMSEPARLFHDWLLQEALRKT